LKDLSHLFLPFSRHHDKNQNFQELIIKRNILTDFDTSPCLLLELQCSDN